MADLHWWAGEISRRTAIDPAPLSFAQQRLWFLAQLEPDSALYNTPFVLHISGPLDVECLRQSLDTIVARHEALRTCFPARNGEPHQVIMPPSAMPLPIVELPELPTAEREDAMMRRVVEVAAQPFDLERGPLFRSLLIRAAPAEHALVLLMHHIVTDRWSVGVLFRELSECYRAFRSGETPRLPDLPVQYADFAVWQRAGLDGERLERLLEYWRSRLAGVSPVLELPTDRPRPAVETWRGSRRQRPLPQRLVQALRALGRQANATLYMVLLGAFQVLLARYTGRQDIVVGSPIAGRMHTKLEPLIGFFINTLALRTDLSGDPTFRQLLSRVREVALGAFTHQELPFERLVEAVQPERSLHHAPLVQVVLALQNTPFTEPELPGLTVHRIAVRDQPAKFDLVLYLIPEEQGALRAEAEYRADLFDATTIDRLLEHYQVLLDGIVADPDRPISALPLVSEDERRRTVVEWNATDTDYPANATVHGLFQAQAQRTPEALAVVSGRGDLSYAELNGRANRLARHLQAQGVGPDTRVAVFLERSADIIVSLLAILKAGGAYLSLDPASPRDRIVWLLDDAGVPVLVTEPAMRERLPSIPPGITVVCLEQDRARIESCSDTDPSSSAGPAHLAYVSYTSGSTGTPKGVAVPHRAVVRLVRDNPYTRFAADEVFLQLAPVAFDASTLEIWGALLNGGRLAVAPPGRLTLAELGGVLQRYGVTTLWLTAGLFHLMVDERLDDLRGVRNLLAGGDVLSPSHVRRVLNRLPQCRLVNGYGPTECTTFTTCHPVAGDGDIAVSVPIGRPIANTRVYVLDAKGTPAPVGVPGELYVGGAGLARGYLDRPALTAERFVPDPFGRAGERLYRTGDRVRWRPGGSLEYLGRLDRQVKLRGFRVEPGEIEAELARHPGVLEAVVVVREDPGGERRLVAYLVPARTDGLDRPLSSNALREHLSLRLPEYMVPAAFVWLEALPLTPQGKVDRAALPAPSPDPAGRGAEPVGTVAPRTPAEARLAEIWAQVLGLDHVGIHDNFFSLGGDSILSLQIIARASQAGLRLTPRQLFEHQTVAELAAAADIAPERRIEESAVPGPIPLTPVQQWFFEQQLPQPHHWNQAILLELREELYPELLERVFQALVIHHDAFRLRFHQRQGGWEQVIVAAEANPIFSSVDLSALGEGEQVRALRETAARLQGGLDLSDGPLMRAARFDLGPDRPGRLLWLIHHLAVDGVSWRVLIEDLQLAYAQLRRGEPIRLPPRTTSFGHWAQRLKAHAQSSELRQELQHWVQSDGARVPPLPVDHPEGSNTQASARTVWVALEEEETRSLLQEVPSAYGTQINDCLLTAVTEAFAPWTGTRALLVDLEGHGREDVVDGVDLTRTVGWFTSIYPVLLDLTSSATPGEALKSVKEQLRAIPGRGIGYGLLRYMSGDAAIAERLRAAPEPQVSFNYLGQFDQTLQSAGFEWVAEPIEGSQGADGARRHLLSINGSIRANRLRIGWTYSTAVHRPATIEALAERFLIALRELIRHCRIPEVVGYTPSDFPDAGLDQRELDALISRLDRPVTEG